QESHAGRGFAGEPAEAGIFDAKTQRLRHVVAQADAIVDAVARAARVAGYQRSACKQRPRVALRVTEASVQRQAANEFPARIDVRIPRAQAGIGERTPRAQAAGHERARRMQSVLVGGVEGRLDRNVAAPTISTKD